MACSCRWCDGARDALALLAAVEREDEAAVRVLHAEGDAQAMLVAMSGFLAQVLTDAGTDPAWWAGAMLEQLRDDPVQA